MPTRELAATDLVRDVYVAPAVSRPQGDFCRDDDSRVVALRQRDRPRTVDEALSDAAHGVAPVAAQPRTCCTRGVRDPGSHTGRLTRGRARGPSERPLQYGDSA